MSTWLLLVGTILLAILMGVGLLVAGNITMYHWVQTLCPHHMYWNGDAWACPVVVAR